ncbi:Gustatory receptor 156 [Halyomorpha halys]|nr:Gustatory receptor 156 [Halyomorpha halys]
MYSEALLIILNSSAGPMERVLQEILTKTRYSGMLPLNNSFQIQKIRLIIDSLINALVIWEFLILTFGEPFSKKNFVVTISLLIASSFIIILIATSPILLVKRNYLMKMIDNLIDADHFLQRMGVETAYHSSTISYILLNLFPTILVCYLFTYFFEFLSIGYLLAVTFHFFIISKMFAVLEMTVQFMYNMNRLLHGLCTTIQNLPSKEISKTLPNLHILIDCHNLVCDSSQCLIKFLGYDVLLLLAIILAYVIVHVYFFYLESNNSVIEIVDRVCRIMWIMMYIMWLERIVHEAQLLTDKSKEFNIRLYTIMLEDKTYLLCDNDKLCLHIAVKNEAFFSACGFFNVNHSLMHSMVAAATSYLVVLIQLERQIARNLASSATTSVSLSNITMDYVTPS